MSEPISALAAIGLAENIAQFVHYALKIVSEGNEAYKSVDDANLVNAHLERVTRELEASSIELSTSLSTCKAQSRNQTSYGEDAGLIDNVIMQEHLESHPRSPESSQDLIGQASALEEPQAGAKDGMEQR